MGNVGIDGTVGIDGIDGIDGSGGSTFAGRAQNRRWPTTCGASVRPRRLATPAGSTAIGSTCDGILQSQLCGALCRNRTDDLFLTMEMLYRLS